MKNNLLYFRFRTWHFCVLLTGFSLFVFLAETVFYRQVPEQQLSYLYEEVTGKPDNIRLGFILFTGNEPYSGQMEHILADTALQHGWDAQLFRVNAEEASELSAAYRISGTPSIIILQDGRERCRLLGMIPAENLQHIYQRFTY